ncbi:unnamed protein product [Sympodiomycopsis kandeliae]
MFSTTELQRWHPHELSLQETRGYSDAVMDGPQSLVSGVSYGSSSFLSHLQFLPLTTLDSTGRPWISILASCTGQPGFIQVIEGEGNEDAVGLIRLKNVHLPKGTPLREQIQHADGRKLNIDPSDRDSSNAKVLIAGVGVLLTNRRRNKYDGFIETVKQDQHNSDSWDIDLRIIATIGNCPKYINTRILTPSPSSPSASLPIEPSLTHPVDTPIPSHLLSIISQADLIYLGTLHTGSTDTWYTDRSKLGCNIRGGRPGFLRNYWDTHTKRHCLLLPDFSGNRFLQSLGNILGDPVAGITIPVFNHDTSKQASDVLYMTCDAQVLSGQKASKELRGFQGLVKLWITGYVYIQDALPFTQRGQAEDVPVGWSPYNPPLRYSRLENGSTQEDTQQEETTYEATLCDVIAHSEEIATFKWRLPTTSPLLQQYKAGQYIITNSHHLLDTRITLYAHMAQFPGGEHELNDDGTRNWTISGVDTSRNTFEITLRRKARGGVTPNLFNMAKRAVATAKEQGEMPSWTPKLNVLAIEGEFTLPDDDSPLAFMYLTSGIGITTFMAHLSALSSADGEMDITAVLACKSNEVDVLIQLLQHSIKSDSSQAQLKNRVPGQVHILYRHDPTSTPSSSSPQTLSSTTTTLEIHTHPNARLTPSSLGEGTEAWTLPSSSLQPFRSERRRRFYICGSDQFQNIALRALTLAKELRIQMAEEVVMEKFTY